MDAHLVQISHCAFRNLMRIAIGAKSESASTLPSIFSFFRREPAFVSPRAAPAGSPAGADYSLAFPRMANDVTAVLKIL
jgi:hypothetical protein